MSLKKFTEKLSYVCLKDNVMKGGVRLVDTMPRIIEKDSIGLDSAVVQAARVSYGAGTKQVSGDKSLISYLLQHQHTTPFEMVDFKFHIKAPIFVTRQWMRHRAGTFNEISGRYSEIQAEWYEPEAPRSQSLVNKQGSGKAMISTYWDEYMEGCENQNKLYNEVLDEGVAKEIARIGLPQSMYTEFYWKVNLHNLLRFLYLRSHNTAQQEIREYAEVIKDMITPLCPSTMEAYENHVENSITLSKKEIECIRDLKEFKGTNREKAEYLTKIEDLGLW